MLYITDLHKFTNGQSCRMWFSALQRNPIFSHVFVEISWHIYLSVCIDPLNPRGKYMYHKFENERTIHFTTKCVFGFRMDLKKKKQRLFPYTA